MKAVARLIWSYFTASPVLRVFTICGLALIAIDFYILMTQPRPGEMLWLAFVGLIVFFVGSSSMPVMFGRLARSHLAGILPGGRIKLLASAFITILLVALPAGVLWPAGFTVGTSTFPEILHDPTTRIYLLQLAAITYTSAVLIAGWIYLAAWFVSQRKSGGETKALLVVVLIVFVPGREIRDLTVSLTWNLQQIAVVWLVFGAGFLWWPRIAAARTRRKGSRFASLAHRLSGGGTGRGFDVLLGATNPWMQVAAQVLPLVLMFKLFPRFREAPMVWAIVLMTMSGIVGATSGQAAERSRKLWLRGNWSRPELFAQIERSVWRQNALVLGVLVLVILGVGAYSHFPTTMLMTGLPLLVLATVLSTYLGLMMTRGLRWREIMAAVAVIIALGILANFIAREGFDLVSVLLLEACLVLLAIVLRSIARRRWSRIDWMECRPERNLIARDA